MRKEISIDLHLHFDGSLSISNARELAALEGVVATEEEINEEYQRIADAYHLEVEQVKGMLDDASIIADLQVKKAMDIVKESAVVKAE